ncbi:Gem-associated protein 6 [Habropoda laboriosa]|uniref:Gem-associated protein 6 n=1 Tax=Habropoda laboriosa TaxID=597456 RepID=A0A0L7QS70_9HYME|nr:PREDICTED: gem-associated protein 6-like [Habropoda laboriosa]KOC61384.1 Gem-associated protein 6 [Habropoda laboriosa]
MGENSDFSHKIYKNDPLLFKSYIGMEVNILTEDGTTISGIVYTVDPVSESVVLLQGNQQNRLNIVFGHAIKNVEICSDKPVKLPELFTNTPTNILQSTIEERKNAVIKMLKENRFSVKQENDILTIENVLLIKPPYEPANCICANSIILGRIQDLLSRVGN